MVMGLSISSDDTLPLGVFRPITLTLTCECGGLFCPTFKATGDERRGYIELQSEATALGWRFSENRWHCPEH